MARGKFCEFSCGVKVIIWEIVLQKKKKINFDLFVSSFQKLTLYKKVTPNLNGNRCKDFTVA